MNSSGLLLTVNPDGGADIVYEDYGTDLFGGDCEVTYRLNRENYLKLLKLIGCPENTNASEYICNKFGNNFDEISFCEYCDTNGIMYDKSAWCE